MTVLAGMVSIDEERNGVISFESVQLTKWGLISAWSNSALVTSTPFAKEVRTATANSPQSLPPFFFPIFIRLTMTGGRKTSSDSEIADKVSASWLLYRES